MANIRKPYCKCGVKKTAKNTSVRWTENGDERLHYLCLKCDSIRGSKNNLHKKTLKELTDLYAKHTRNAELVKQVILEKVVA